MLGILAPLPISAMAVSSNNASAPNMLTPSPREVWASASITGVDIDIDFGSAVQFDRIYIGGSNMPADIGATFNRATGMGAGFTFEGSAAAIRLSSSDGPRHQAIVTRPAGPATRYYRLTLNWSVAQSLEIGVLAIGSMFTHPYAFGSGRIPIDMSRVSDLQDGGYGIDEGAMKTGFRWRFIDLDDAKRELLWSLVSRRGISKPVVVIENTTATPLTDAAVHYGRFEKFEAWERANAIDTVWALSMVEWR
jgi:hypothetical protein